MKQDFLKIRTDEANGLQPDFVFLSDSVARVYFNHRHEEREEMDGGKVTVFLAEFVDVDFDWETSALALAKKAVIGAITAYDASSEVNQFTVNGVSTWLDVEKRGGLKRRFEVEQSKGITESKLSLDDAGTTVTVTPAQGLQMLDELEYYAVQCFDKTQEHKAVVSNMTKVEDIMAYDFTAGYPEKPAF